MGLFNRKFWIDAKGEVACPGDSCKHTCNDSCPIWLNTQAIQCLMIGDAKNAASKLQKAVNLEPNFIGAYNNLGAAYGMIGEYDKSVQAYKKKLELVPNDVDAMFGVAVSLKNNGRFEEALKYCDMYETAGGEKGRIQKVRSECGETKNVKESSVTSSVNFLQTILDEESGANHFEFHGGFPHIPEVMGQAEQTVYTMETELGKLSEERRFPLIAHMKFMAAWCAYAGMGAVAIWNDDFNRFSSGNIADILISERGVDEMDEYVTELMGIEFGGNSDDKLRHELLDIFDRHCGELFDDEENLSSDSYLAFNVAMFMYGMIYEMSRLGMH